EPEQGDRRGTGRRQGCQDGTAVSRLLTRGHQQLRPWTASPRPVTPYVQARARGRPFYCPCYCESAHAYAYANGRGSADLSDVIRCRWCTWCHNERRRNG